MVISSSFSVQITAVTVFICPHWKHQNGKYPETGQHACVCSEICRMQLMHNAWTSENDTEKSLHLLRLPRFSAISFLSSLFLSFPFSPIFAFISPFYNHLYSFSSLIHNPIKVLAAAVQFNSQL